MAAALVEKMDFAVVESLGAEKEWLTVALLGHLLESLKAE